MAFQKGDPRINRAGRPAGAVSYKTRLQDALINVMDSEVTVGKTKMPYYIAFLEKLKKQALIPGTKEHLWMAQRLLSENVLDDIDRQLNKSKREDRDFLTYRVFKDCHDYQQKILLSMEKFIYLMAGRRAGKSEGDAKKAVYVALDKPEARVLFIGLSFTRCLEVFWNPVKDLLEMLGIEIVEQRRTEGMMKLFNGSEIHFHGNTTTDERDKLRGSKWHLVIIDEVQSQKALPILINEILEPTLVDYKGQLILSGTGPRTRGTYWEELWTNNKQALRLNWNISHNPFIPDYEKVLEEIKKEKNLTDSSPLFQREYLGQISYDDDALCFRIKPENCYTDDELLAWIQSQPVTDMKFTAGLDFGYTDADGFAIILFSTSRPERWLVYEHKANRSGISELAEHINKGIEFVNTSPLFASIPDKRFYIYSDGGGGGKKISVELATTFNLPCVDAYKVDKDIAIEQLQEEVRTNRFKIRDNGYFYDEALKTVFKRNERDELTRVIDDDTFHPDLADAILYALRFVWINYGKNQ